MQLSLKYVLAAALLLATGVAADTCSSIRQRREFRTLSASERLDYINAIKSLQSQSPRPNKYDAYVARHVAVTTYAHGTPRFLSWHRAFIRTLEKDLQSINPSVMLPYWDWAYDSQAPEASIIFTDAYYGGDGNANQNRCVTNGQFTSWKPQNGKNCIARNFDNGQSNKIPALWSWEALNSWVFNAKDYDTFRKSVEGPHGNVHNGIGDQFSTMRSPDDPIFWLHHAFVDKLWDDWQRRASANFRSYGGTNDDGSTARATDNLDYGYTVNDLFDTRSLCYTYAPFDGSIPVTPPPSTTPQTSTRTVSALASTPTSTPTSSPSSTPDSSPSSSPSIPTPTDGGGISLPNPTYIVTPPSTNGTVPDYGTQVNVAVPGVDTNPATNNTGYTPPYDDRSNIINIRPPAQLPDDWCKMNNLDIAYVRRGEQAAHKIVDQFNHLPGYVSKCALANHADVLDKLAQAGIKFHGYIGDKHININYSAGAGNVAQDVQSKVSAVVAQVYNQVSFVYPQVIQNIINAVPVYNGGTTASPLYNIPSILGGGEDNYDDEDCEDEDNYGDDTSAPADNPTYGGIVPYIPILDTPAGELPADNSTYGGEAPAGGDTYTPAPVPASYSAAPAPSGY